jgi:dipeptidase E
MDPESYRNTFLASQNKTDDAVPVSMNASWEYTRVPCLGILPGLVCPHHDRVQSNGVLRATDFEEMMKRHPGEQGFSFRSFFFPFFFSSK